MAHDHSHSSEHDLLIAKCAAMVCLFCATILFGCIPFILNYWLKWTEKKPDSRSAHIVQYLLYFGGGVLLATTFIHLLPEVQEVVEHLQECGNIGETRFALAETLMCAGFFLMYLIEECVHSYLHRHKSGKKSRKDDVSAAFERGHSVRNSVLVRGSKKSKHSQNSCNNSGETLPVTDNSVYENSKYHVSTLTVDTLIDPNCSGKHSDLQLQTNGDGGKRSSSSSACNTPKHHHEHNHENGHGHSHMPLDQNVNDGTVSSSLRGLGIVLALSLHEVFEGLAIGLEDSTSSVWFLFGAVSAHKLVLAFCVGVELIVARTRPILAAIYTVTFAIVSPIGVGIGLGVSHNSSTSEDTLLSAVLQGIACGTLLYVVFFEILSKHHAGLGAFLAMLIGFGLMFGLQNIGEGHDHDHGSCGAEEENIVPTTIRTFLNLTAATPSVAG
ncbi:zinc transporter ZIP3-like [Haematobia irritans]|uniref:zinc transporter ZIP3-like n=1 Tax=Haematobia irritans TaxID=7368 RepID=UPI003F509D3E